MVNVSVMTPDLHFSGCGVSLVFAKEWIRVEEENSAGVFSVLCRLELSDYDGERCLMH